MNIQELDKAALKEVLREILIEDPSLLKTSMRAIIDEMVQPKNAEPSQINPAERAKRVSAIFEEYDEVYKKLA